tara:strand:+ start:137 stop:973 length:837 start_codon:yes stop_codon:yes gene_type:complete
MINIYEYENYREFLKDYFEVKERNGSRLTYRNFSNRAGIPSHTLAQMVIQGKRNLTLNTIPGFVKALDLKKGESIYFENMVGFTQSKTDEEKSYFLEKMYEIRSKKKKGFSLPKVNSDHTKLLFSRWYMPLLYELILLNLFDEDYEKLFDFFEKKVSKVKLKKAVSDLRSSGLVEKNNEGKWVQKTPCLKTQDEVTHLLIRDYQKKMMEFALDKISDPIDQREFGFVTFAGNKSDLKILKNKIKKLLDDFHGETLELKDQDNPPDQIFHFGVQLFGMK